eukprot:TRINITY_DN12105_c0_g1_i4.p1 TRINITY_DN12105_c0_g1~~TRINITY_DN12105_c0_g1_i4.p1  ORF type:complete len:189 (+),score=23.78 TRINITY_DN12105_c0_g1_i4:61-567(+)
MFFEKNFSQKEFIEGSTDAHAAFVQMFNNSEWDDLSEVAATPLVEKCKLIQSKFWELGLQFKVHRNDLQVAELLGFVPGPIRQGHLYRDWLVLGVRFHYNCGIQIWKGGELVLNESEDHWEILLFGKGPLPSKESLPQEDLELSWTVLDAMFFPARLMSLRNQIVPLP